MLNGSECPISPSRASGVVVEAAGESVGKDGPVRAVPAVHWGLRLLPSGSPRCRGAVRAAHLALGRRPHMGA